VVVLGQLRQLRNPDACAHMVPDKVEVEGDSVPHCNWVHRFVADIALRLASAQPHFLLAEGCPLCVRPAGHHQSYEGSCHVNGEEQDGGMCLPRWDWLVEPLNYRVRAGLGIVCDLARSNFFWVVV